MDFDFGGWVTVGRKFRSFLLYYLGDGLQVIHVDFVRAPAEGDWDVRSLDLAHEH